MGRGSLEHFGFHEAANGGPGVGGVTLLAGATLGKAMGGFGGIITGSAEFIRQVRTSSHYYDGSSAPPSPVATATAKSLELVAGDPSFLERLLRNSRRLREGLRGLGVAVHEAPSAQVGVAIGTAENMARLHRELRAEGMIVPVTSYIGTGPEGIMRFAVCSGHTGEMIDDLLAALGRFL